MNSKKNIKHNLPLSLYPSDTDSDIEGNGFVSYKNKFNKKHDLPINDSHTIEEISKLSKYKKKGLQTIYNKGIGAYNTNPESVRPQVNNPEQWAMARVYAAINPTSKAHRVDKSHLVKGNRLPLSLYSSDSDNEYI